MSKILGNYFNRKIFRIAIILVIVILVIYPFVFTKKSFANEISLFPTICEGSWKNASEAAGDPIDNRLAGAESMASGDMISCHSFDLSSLPDDAVVTEAHLELVWASRNNNQFIEPSIEESYDPLAPVPDEELPDSESEINEVNNELESTIPGPEINTLETETAPVIEKNINTIPVEEIKIDSSNSDPILEPTSRIPAWIQSLFISEAKAEESVAPMENSITSNDNQLATTEGEVVSSETEQSKEITSETVVPESVTTTTIPEASEVEIEDNTEEKNEPSKTIEDGLAGTALFNLSYTVATKTEHHLGSVTHEHLSNVYPISLTVDDVAVLKVSLTSLMTFDQIDNLALEGVKLMVEYSSGDSLDPIRQPDLYTDKILDRITLDGVEAIRIERADNKQYEIWYRTIESQQSSETNQNNTEAIVIKEDMQTPVVTESSLLETPSLTSEELIRGDKTISGTEKLIIENPDTESTSLSTETVSPDISLEKKIFKAPEKKKRFYWNFIDGDDSVHRAMPIALQDGYVFWLNKKATVLSSYNILTQGYNSQIYEPESGDNFIMYRSPSSQEKKAILILSEKKFVFTE